VSNLLRLLELAPEITAYVEKRELEMGHARALLGLTQRRHQIEVGALVAKKGLSVRETEALVRSMLAKASGSAPATKDSKALDPNVRRLQDELSEKLGAKVQIEHTGSGKGKVVVSYHSLDELDGILAHIH
jgi:ParB family chromosome partitioning protein